MAKAKRVITSTGNLVRSFSHYSDVALAKPVLVTKHGRPHNVLLSVAEYERLQRGNRQAFLAQDAPHELVADLEAYLRKKSR